MSLGQILGKRVKKTLVRAQGPTLEEELQKSEEVETKLTLNSSSPRQENLWPEVGREGL